MERHKTSGCGQHCTEEGGNFPVSQSKDSWTPWNYKNGLAGITRLLVARHETRYFCLCTRLCHMSGKQKLPWKPKATTIPNKDKENTLPFETFTLDFITKLPESDGYDTILTIVDHDCSKAAFFIPCKETIDAKGVAALLAKTLFPHYGLPRQVISDRDAQITAKLIKEWCNTLGIEQNISTAYHPQTNGQSERANLWVEQYL